LLEKTGLDNYLKVVIPSGEQNKNIDTCQNIWKTLLDAGINRNDLMINLGGGVIGDMGGFCAATYKRGIDFIQIPTTLLAQVDASIGGKLGIDFRLVKNSIGVFKNPLGVFISPLFLQTLTEREIRSGYAEMIKHSLIHSAEEWNRLQSIDDLKTVDWVNFIYTSLLTKQSIVAQDPFEKNIRKSLNFGHTIGHALESLALESDQPLLHGEAIAYGMICESFLSTQTGKLGIAEYEEIKTYILSIFGKYSPATQRFDSLLDLMRKDKKNEDNRINFTLLSTIGAAEVNQYCTTENILDSLKMTLF